jgi:hypothetical protein
MEAGTIIMIPNVSGDFDGGAVVEGDGFGEQKSTVLSNDFTLNFKDPSMSDNIAFYDALQKSRQWRVLWFTDKKVWDSHVVGTVSWKNPVTNSLDSIVTADVTVKWTSQSHPIVAEKPAGVTDCFTS